MRTGRKVRELRGVRPAAGALIVTWFAAPVVAAPEAIRSETESPSSPSPARTRSVDISEFQIEGAAALSQLEVEAAVYPFLGPGRTLDDVEKARAALEKAYSDKGYQSVTVAIPPQRVRGAVVLLKVNEGRVGRLRVRGSHWFLPSEIKRQAPSVAEGTLPNFNDIVRDVFVLNQIPDRRVTPALRAGSLPGTLDVDLNVQDRLPLHGTVEVNNRSSANTTRSRLNASIRYDNLFQQGHSLSLTLQVAPQRLHDAEIFSASYLARLPDTPWLTFSFNGILQNSDISTLGATAVQGRGRIFGARANFTLPGIAGLFHTISAGVDYKHFGKELLVDSNAAPITYWPFNAQYSTSISTGSSQTQASVSVLANLRALSSGQASFDAKRFKASGSFIDLRFELAHTQELPAGFQLFGRLQTQSASGPLIPSEQLVAGGAESVRGYLEAQTAGDNGAFGGLELRTPTLPRTAGGWFHDWTLLVFADGGRLTIREHLPEQEWVALLWSTGGGTRFRLLDFLSGVADVGVPLRSQGNTTRYHPRFHFRVGGEF